MMATIDDEIATMNGLMVGMIDWIGEDGLMMSTMVTMNWR